MNQFSMNHQHTLMIYSSQPTDAEKVASWAWERLKLQKKPVVLDSLAEASHQGLLYFLTQELSPPEKEAIVSAKLRLPQLQLVLCASATFALAAWELDVFHFVPNPVTHLNLLKSYHKYIRAYAKDDTSLTVRYKDMKRIIASSNIMCHFTQ